MKVSLLASCIFASTVSAHFSVTYPYWRGNSNPTQWNYPCGGIAASEATDQNRTLWPLDGGAIAFKPTHTWAQTHINMGLGNNVTSLNITLVEGFNQTSNGTFCLPKVKLPDSVKPKEGDKATIQVIQLTARGAALYNCAEIQFSEKATGPPEGVCVNSTGVGVAPLNYGGPGSPSPSASAGGASPSASADAEGQSAGNILNPSAAMSVLFGAMVVAGLMV